MDVSLPSLAQRIREAREANGLTREGLSERIGVSAKSVQRYEEGRQVPRIQTLERMSTALGVPLQALFEPMGENQERRFVTLADLSRDHAAILARLEDITAGIGRLAQAVERLAAN